jgi:hypothetical protein
MGFDVNNLPRSLTDKMGAKDRQALSKLTPIALTEEDIARLAAKKERETEVEIQDEIERYLRIRGFAFLRPRMDRETTVKIGWPDFTLAPWGIPIAFEVKTDTGKVSPEQERCHREMTSGPNGWRVMVVRNVQEVVSALLALEKFRDHRTPHAGA